MNAAINKNLRLILAVSAAGLPDAINGASLFHPLNHEDTVITLEKAGLWFGPRPTLEEDESFRQPIPYIVLRYGDKIISYTRTDAGEESRLHGRVSIGLGGHVDVGDVESFNEQIDLYTTLSNAVERELEEELGGVQVDTRRWVGLLGENASPVGRVHIGVIGVWDITRVTGVNADEFLEELRENCEDAVGEISLVSVAELREMEDRLEPWSAMLLDYLDAPAQA